MLLTSRAGHGRDKAVEKLGPMAESGDSANKFLNRYEIVAIAVPGAVLLFGAWWLKAIPQLSVDPKDISVGAFGLFTIAAFCAGHLIQTIADLIGEVWHKVLRVKRSTYGILTKLPPHLSDKIQPQLQSILGYDMVGDVKDFDPSAVVFDIIAVVRNAGRSGMLETFLDINHLLRGLAVAFAFLAVWAIATKEYPAAAALSLLCTLVMVRAYTFDRHYAWELWRQFVLIDPSATGRQNQDQAQDLASR
jgi:hypothetical protein